MNKRWIRSNWATWSNRGLAGMFMILLSGIALCAAEPSQDLASQQARPTPEWLSRGVIYQVWLRSFTPEGTLAAATKRIPAVADLGANILYLCPICFQDADMRQEYWSNRQKASGTNNPRNPYRIADYNRVDPEYGSEEDLREFVATAHRHGLRVLLDLVYYHCGPTSTLMEHPDWFKHDPSGEISTGEWHFPVLDFKNQQLREYLWANMLHWVKDFDLDGFRCDVADSVPLDFWEEARARLEAVRPDVVILAEGQRPADQRKAFDIDYGFSWYNTLHGVFTHSQPASSLRTIWEKQKKERPQGARFTRHTENHDIVNDLQRADVMFSKQGNAAISVVNFMIDGVPFLYNGQEIGDNSVQSIYAKWPIRWEAACLPSSQATYRFYQKLCQLRRNEIVLTAGEVLWLDNDQPNAVVSFLRRAGDEQILCAANLSNRKVKAQIRRPKDVATTFAPLLSEGARATWTDGQATVEFEGFGYFAGKKKP